MFAVISLAAALLAGDSLPALAPSLSRPGAIGTAAVVVHRQPALPVVSLRLSVVAGDPPGYAGAGHLIQHLLYPSLRERVARVGGRVQLQRTSDAIVYTVTGPAAELDHLAAVLKSTLQTPRATEDAILRAGRELREERLAEWEMAAAHARSLLRNQLFPTDISAAGTDRSAARFTSGILPDLWAEMYRHERVSVVAVGDVYLGDVERAFAELPDPPPARPLAITRDSVLFAPIAPPEATRARVGIGYLASDLDPAALAVTTRLLGAQIRRRLPSAQVEAEHWWTHHGAAIALVVSVSGPELAAAQRVVGTALSSLQADLGFLQVVDAAAAIRREMLFYARTPDRMAEVIGLFTDRDGDPNAAERFYADLAELDDLDIHRVLDRLAERSPVRVEMPPQALQRRQ